MIDHTAAQREPRHKLLYRVASSEEHAFIDEFQALWTDEQFEMMTSGYKGTGQLPQGIDAASVDPGRDPVLARQVLLAPPDALIVGERPFVLPLMELIAGAKRDVPPQIEALSKSYDIYVLKYSLNLSRARGQTVTDFCIHTDYHGTSGVMTLMMAPHRGIEEGFPVGRRVAVGVDASGAIHMETDPSGILLCHWAYRILGAVITAEGQNSSYAKWSVEQLQDTADSIPLVAVTCVPRGAATLSVSITGRYHMIRGLPWWRRRTPVDITPKEPLSVPLATKYQEVLPAQAPTKALHRAVMVADIEKFSSRLDNEQLALRATLSVILAESFDDAGIPWHECHVEDRGDGKLIVAPPMHPKVDLTDLLPQRLAAALRRHNALASPDTRMRLRLALHAGEVHRDADGVAGNAVNTAFRLNQAEHLKKRFASHDGDLALIVSDQWFQDVVRHDPGSYPNAYEQIPPPRDVSASPWVRLLS